MNSIMNLFFIEVENMLIKLFFCNSIGIFKL